MTEKDRQDRTLTALSAQRDLAIALNTTRTISAAFDLLFETLRKLDLADSGGVYVMDQTTGDLDMVAHTGLSDEFVAAASHYGSDSPQNQIVKAGESMFTHYNQILPVEDLALTVEEQLKAIAVIPLWHKGNLAGALNISSHKVDEFSPESRLLLEGLAAQMAGLVIRVLFEEERLALEGKFRQAQKLESLGVLAGGIAHDFNNLLVGILGNTDLALLDLQDDSPARRRVQDIGIAAKRAADLPRQMLAYSGKGRFVVETVRLEAIVDEMTHLLAASKSKKARFIYEFSADTPAIEADATQIRQIVMNLITNASEALGESSGTITVRTGKLSCDRTFLDTSYIDNDLPEGEYSYLEVEDDGAGMDEETRSRIFDPFYTTKFTGRGLGLAAVLGIMRAHQGTIMVRSAPGKGSSFKVLFPAATGARTSNDRRAAVVADWKGSGTVLLVDDEEMVRQVVGEMLSLCGFQVVTATNGREAAETLARDPGKFSFVLLDLTMPEMDGEECFRLLRETRNDIRIILSSGFSEQEILDRFLSDEITGFIQKPFSFEQLKELLREVLND